MDTQKSLTTIEQSELSRLESIIEKGQRTFVEVGSALMEIRDSGLYKQHGTFEQYCKQRWGYARTTAYYLIESCKVIENVQHVEHGAPSSLRQTIPLSKLTPPQQKEAWKKAVETAPEGKVTAKHVEKAVDEIMGKPKREQEVIKEDSDELFQLKRWWKKATKKDRKLFTIWVKSQEGGKV